MLNKLRLWSYLGVGAVQIVLGASLWGWGAKKAFAAEDIILGYGVLEFAVSVDSLETYAKTGELQGALRSYADLLSPEQLEQLKDWFNY